VKISSYQEIIYGLSPGKAEGFYRRKRDVSRKTPGPPLQGRIFLRTPGRLLFLEWGPAETMDFTGKRTMPVPL
jgi:hypothetical protein